MLQRTIFIREPGLKYRSFRGGLYNFRTLGQPKESEDFCCLGEEAEVRKIVNEILDMDLNILLGTKKSTSLLDAIERYGNARVEVERGDRAEDDAEEDL